MDGEAMTLALTNEVNLLERVPSNRERLDAMYRAHYRGLWRILRRLGYDEEVCADATQQSYLVAVERIDSIYLGSERAFLFATGLRVVKSLARKARRDELRGDDAAEEPPDPRGAFADRHAARDVLARLFETMEETLVVVFVLHEIEGFSSPEIAETLSIPLGTVASRLRRAREAFKERAKALEADPEERRRVLGKSEENP